MGCTVRITGLYIGQRRHQAGIDIDDTVVGATRCQVGRLVAAMASGKGAAGRKYFVLNIVEAGSQSQVSKGKQAKNNCKMG